MLCRFPLCLLRKWGLFWSQAPVILRPRDRDRNYHTVTLEHQVPLLFGLIVPSPQGDLRTCLRPPRGTPASLSMEGTRDKERNQGPRRMEGQGRIREQGNPAGGNEWDWEYVCSLGNFLGAGPGDRIRRCNRAAGRRGQVPGCPG